MVIREKWINSMYNQMMMIYPDRDKKEIMAFLEKKFDKKFKDVECTAYNNYEEETFDTTLSKIMDWCDRKKPIMTESGTFFKKHSESYNPNTVILQNKLDDRKVKKKEKFKYKELAINTVNKELRAEYFDMAEAADLSQNRLKKIANSEYGVSGMPSSFMYNLACAATTTLKGQHLIATAFCSFENFLQDNVLFYDMDECVQYIKNILDEESKWTKDISDIVNISVSEDRLYRRLLRKFKDKDNCSEDILKKIISNLDDELRQRVYYKNNLYELIDDSTVIQNLLENIMLYHGDFLNPVKPPKEIEKALKKLNKYLLEFVHYNHPIYDKVYRLKTEYRKCVRVIDTDSNFVDLSHWDAYVNNNILNKYTKVTRTRIDGKILIPSRKGETEKKRENRQFKAVNTMTHVLGNMIANVLLRYVDECGVEPDAPGDTSMKNEFLYTEILNTASKKHYIGKYKLQEGKYFPEPQTDTKGMEWNKRTYASEYAMAFNKDLAYNHILTDNMDMKEIINKLNDYENQIYESIMRGEFKFLNVKKVRAEDGYSDPMSIGQYKAAYVWNMLYPDDQIELPGRIYMLKVNLSKPKDFAKLSVDNPEMFDRLMYLFNNNKRIKEGGITSIGIPLEGKIPEWIKPYININTTIEANLGLSFTMLNALGITQTFRTKSNKFFSNIVQL